MRSDPVSASLARWVSRWWAGQGGTAGKLLDPLLAPAELAYRGAVLGRNAAFDRRLRPTETAPIPVVSVGNLSVGGAGKTPVAAWVAARLRAQGHRPAVVLRGYGRDEVLVHRALNPGVAVIPGAKRISAVREAARRGCDVAVVDDGYQHRSLARDLDLLLVAAESTEHSLRLLPRGPWREPLRAARRADLIVITRKSADQRQAQRAARLVGAAAVGVPIVHCRLAPAALRALHGGPPLPLRAIAGERVLAVAALASPDPFAANLHGSGAEVELAAFPDHHEFTAAEADALVTRAAGRTLVMTLKDAVKLRDLLRPPIPALVLLQEVRLESGAETLLRALDRLTRRGR